jgi:uncharacterized protein YcaQ
MEVDRLSLARARRIALAAQGFDRPRPPRVTRRHLRDLVRRLGLLQIDFVNVLVPSHYLVPFTRLGSYDRSLLEDVVYRRREFTECWAHEASIVPVETWPLLRHRLQGHRWHPRGYDAFIERHPDYPHWVLEQVRLRGALAADELAVPDGAERKLPGSWFGNVPRAVLEGHFGSGLLAVASRRPSFARTYDLVERVIPAEQVERRVGLAEAERELLAIAARAHGVATAADLADYWRMSIRDARARLAELVEDGRLRPVEVEGWRERAYLDPGVRAPRPIRAAALLSPFDPLLWTRARASRLFGFDYRFEIFVPRAQRRWGVYVLPFLLGEQLVARVDLKAERSAGTLVVGAGSVEPEADQAQVAAALATELGRLAAWLGLESVRFARRGVLSSRLAAALAG